MFKALKHKTLPGTWGIFCEDGVIAQCSTPNLHPPLVNVEDLTNYWLKRGIEIDLTNWDLVTVELRIV